MPEVAIFNAPWGTSLKVITLLGCLVLLGIILVGLFTGPRSVSRWLLMVVLPVITLMLTALFMVQGYALAGDTLYVQRLGWHTAISLTQLESVTIDPHAMDHSIRIWGNGGLFGVVGHFRNQRLGPYYAYATKLDCSVVLRFPQRRLVVTPDDPERFARSISARNS